MKIIIHLFVLFSLTSSLVQADENNVLSLNNEISSCIVRVTNDFLKNRYQIKVDENRSNMCFEEVLELYSKHFKGLNKELKNTFLDDISFSLSFPDIESSLNDLPKERIITTHYYSFDKKESFEIKRKIEYSNGNLTIEDEIDRMKLDESVYIPYEEIKINYNVDLQNRCKANLTQISYVTNNYLTSLDNSDELLVTEKKFNVLNKTGGEFSNRFSKKELKRKSLIEQNEEKFITTDGIRFKDFDIEWGALNVLAKKINNDGLYYVEISDSDDNLVVITEGQKGKFEHTKDAEGHTLDYELTVSYEDFIKTYSLNTGPPRRYKIY